MIKKLQYVRYTMLVIFLFIAAILSNAQGLPITDKPELLEIGKFSQDIIPVPNEIKIVSYNIRYQGGQNLQRLIEFLRKDVEIGGASIICLQEVDRNRKRTNFVNTVRLIAQELKLNYVWAAPLPPPNSKEDVEEETGVAILSLYEISDVERILMPNPGPSGRTRVAVGGTIQIGTHRVRVYSVHVDLRISTKKKMQQLRSVMESLSHQSTVTSFLVMGDFNTISKADRRACIELFNNNGFTTPIPHDQSTWKTFIIKLKLDWIWVKGLKATEYGIAKHIDLSDHSPLWIKVNF